MGFIESLLLAISLGMDAFSVALGMGARYHLPRQAFRLSWHFAFFQFAMPFVGWAIGRGLGGILGSLGKWIALVVLVSIGIKFIIGFIKKDGSFSSKDSDPTRGISLVMLSFAVSMDALVVGFGIGLIISNLLQTCILMGIVTFIMTMIGIYLGRAIQSMLGRWAELIGGIVLIAIALKIVMHS